jgi:hypothetical protein
MPFPIQILDDLATTGANITIDASKSTIDLKKLTAAWSKGIGTVTIRNAGQLDPGNLVDVAKALRNRLTLEE